MNQKGFTLIEMIVVIILLAILSVTAMPKFINLSDEAKAAAVAGLAASISSESKINFAGFLLSGVFNFGNSAPATSSKVVSTSTTLGACRSLLPLFLGLQSVGASALSAGAFTGNLPGGMSISNDQVCGVTVSNGAVAQCEIYNVASPYISAAASVVCTPS